jgi:predicted P-loop ATPase
MDPLTYLEDHCELRRNVLTGEILFSGDDGEYHILSSEAANTLLLKARQKGIQLDHETLDDFVHSTLIESWNPAESWLASLSEWDGEDRVEALAQRVITSNAEWPKSFHTWMLQMVARWKGMKIDQRDVTVPMLVGQWGSGKTSFCNKLLPPALRRYYVDKMKLRTTADVHDLVSGNLLVCLDEYYQGNDDQQPLSQYLFSRSEPIFRQPYGVNAEPRRAFAAVIGNTGNLHPMTDAAGAARLVCVEVERKIDLKTPIDYEQLYAQLSQEVDEGNDWSLTDAERERRAIQNAPYQEADNLVKMVQTLYGAPKSGQRVKATRIDKIIDRLMKEYPYWTPGEHVNQDVGFALQEAGFIRSRIHGRSTYKVVEKDPRKLDFIEEPEEEEESTSYDNNPLAKALLTGLGSLAKQAKKPK